MKSTKTLKEKTLQKFYLFLYIPFVPQRYTQKNKDNFTFLFH